jgi:dihydrofolate reductase
MISIIAAVDDKWGFGKDGKIPWDSKEDRENFRELTHESFCIMGRLTYEDMCAYFKKDILMPRRYPIVVGRNVQVKHSNVKAVETMEEAIELTKNRLVAKETCFIGGRRIFEAAFRYGAEIATITRMQGDYGCDVFFPHELFEVFKFNRMFGERTESGLCYETYVRDKSMEFTPLPKDKP